MLAYKGITGKHTPFLSIFFFILGIIGGLGLRLVLILNHFNELISRICWYIAMFSFVIFYYYRFYIEKRRQEILIKNNLREKLIRNKLTKEDRDKLRTIIDSQLASKLKLNALILFILTIVALIVEFIIETNIK